MPFRWAVICCKLFSSVWVQICYRSNQKARLKASSSDGFPLKHCLLVSAKRQPETDNMEMRGKRELIAVLNENGVKEWTPLFWWTKTCLDQNRIFGTKLHMCIRKGVVLSVYLSSLLLLPLNGWGSVLWALNSQIVGLSATLCLCLFVCDLREIARSKYLSEVKRCFLADFKVTGLLL